MLEKCLYKVFLFFYLLLGFVSEQKVVSRVDRTIIRIGMLFRYTIDLTGNNGESGITLSILESCCDRIVVLSKNWKKKKEWMLSVSNIDMNFC
ncbi:MAG: hypothetical protein ACMUEM_04395 [Flavobacteriales bacterium AspAUS03]